MIKAIETNALKTAINIITCDFLIWTTFCESRQYKFGVDAVPFYILQGI